MDKYKQTARKFRIIAIVAVVGVLAIIGGAIAYNGNFSIFPNFFGVYNRRNVITDEFVSPDDWQPCQSTPKTITVKNEGSIPTVARLKYEEYWKLINSTDTSHTTELPLAVNGSPVVITAVTLSQGWTLGTDGWYYTDETIAPGETYDAFTLNFTINCNFNFAAGMTKSTEGNVTTYESNLSDYSNAKYHAYVTVETEDAETNTWCGDGEQGIPCPAEHRETLYDYIAKQTNGRDDDVRFSFYTTSFKSSLPGYTNGEGVNTLAAHANDDYPVYYYRGDEYLNNLVVFNGFCWRILRTAEHGAVKLLYAGQYQGQCLEPYNNSSAMTINNGNSIYFNDDYSGYYSWSAYFPTNEVVGYMRKHAKATDNWDYSMTYWYKNWSNRGAQPIEGKVADSVTYDGEFYHLQGIHDTIPSPPYYHYFCMKQPYEYQYQSGSSTYTGYIDATRSDATADTCREVDYWIPGFSGSSDYYAFKFKNGATVETYFDDMHTNLINSKFKNVVDQWYRTYFTSADASVRDKLADVVYCNERTSTYNPFSSPNGHYGSNFVFDSYVRVTGMVNNDDATPSVDCSDIRDSFTVSKYNGNGDLTYPIGLITADEMSLSGVPFRGGYRNIDSGYYSWSNRSGLSDGSYESGKYPYIHGNYYLSMSPIYIDNSGYQMVNYSGGNQNGNPSGSVRPVIALKYDTYIQSGTGSMSDPFFLE